MSLSGTTLQDRTDWLFVQLAGCYLRQSLLHGRSENKELINLGDLQRGEEAVVSPNDHKLSARVLAGDVGAHQAANSRRVNVRHIADVDDQNARVVGPHHGLEGEE